MSSKQNNSGASTSKKIRMTMACERCRLKKVKCDFTHPECWRCSHAKAQCSYTGSSTQVDLFSLIRLNETVDLLQKKVKSIESDMKQNQSAAAANDVGSNQKLPHTALARIGSTSSSSSSSSRSSNEETSNQIPTKRSANDLITTSNTQWSLSLTPKGLRIDTNIVSLHDLYDILLSGVSQFDLSTGNCMHDPAEHLATSSICSPGPSPESPKIEHTTILRKKPLWKSRLKTHPLYSTWAPEVKEQNKEHSKRVFQETYKLDVVSEETFYKLIAVFDGCFLCLPCIDPSISIRSRYENGTLDPLLANSVLAWTSRHTAIFHDMFPGRDPNQVGQVFYLKAKELVKERFMKTSVDTMFSLLIMYIYTIGIPSENKSEVESEAYIYLGLAIRMCLDMKLNLESTSTDPHEQELNRRFFWVLYFLETLASIHSDRSFALPPKNMITVKFPTLMEHELSGETKYRVEFIIQRFKIARIYRSIISKTTEEKPLFSQISAIDKELQSWYTDLPSYFKYEPGDVRTDRWDSPSFKEQACIKLNFEYNFQLCQLYGIFFSKTSDATASSIELISRVVCLKAAEITVELLECWTRLDQLWCHFSLENLMATTIIYSYVIAHPREEGEREIAQKNLGKMAKILVSSPVRRHKYVLTLVSKITEILQDTLNTDVNFDEEETSSSSLPPSLPPQQQQQPSQVTTQLPQEELVMQPISLTNQYTRRNSFLNVLDAASSFDPIKTSTVSEDINFSDFVYNPALLGFNDNPLLEQYMYNQQPPPPPSSSSPPPIASATDETTTYEQWQPSLQTDNKEQHPFVNQQQFQEGYHTVTSPALQFYNHPNPYNNTNNHNNNNSYYQQ